jgi:glucose-6-phosphate isomerase
MKLRKNAIKPLRFDPSALIGPERAIDANDWSEVLERLVQVRDEMLQASSSETPELELSTNTVSSSNIAFVSWPDRLLNAYANDRRGSELGRLFRRATHLHSVVDRVVVVAVDGSLFGARSILESCCQPFWNELSRADRGSKPRIVFEDSSWDNDAVQGLLHLLDAHRNRPPTCELDRWALVVIGSNEETLNTSVTLQRVLDAF